MRMVAIILGIAGFGSLTITTVQLVRLACPMESLEPMLWGGLGLFLLCADALLLIVIGQETRRWRGTGIAQGCIVLGVVFFFVVIMPWSTEQRIRRHRQRMTTIGVPLLDEIVDSIETMRDESGEIPSDEREFCQTIVGGYHVRLVALQCCYNIEYRKLDEQDFTLRYSTMDVEYAYDSRNAGCGWHPVPGN